MVDPAGLSITDREGRRGIADMRNGAGRAIGPWRRVERGLAVAEEAVVVLRDDVRREELEQIEGKDGKERPVDAGLGGNTEEVEDPSGQGAAQQIGHRLGEEHRQEQRADAADEGDLRYPMHTRVGKYRAGQAECLADM